MQTRLIGEIMFEFLVGTAAAIYIWNHLNKKLDIDISKKIK